MMVCLFVFFWGGGEVVNIKKTWFLCGYKDVFL